MLEAIGKWIKSASWIWWALLFCLIVIHRIYSQILKKRTKRVKRLKEKLKTEVDEEKKKQDEQPAYLPTYNALAYYYDQRSRFLFFIPKVEEGPYSMIALNTKTGKMKELFSIGNLLKHSVPPLLAFNGSTLFVITDCNTNFYYHVSKKTLGTKNGLPTFGARSMVAIGDQVVINFAEELALFELTDSGFVENQRFQAFGACHLNGLTYLYSDGEDLCISSLQNDRLHCQKLKIKADKNARITRRSNNIFELAITSDESHIYLAEMVDGSTKLHFVKKRTLSDKESGLNGTSDQQLFDLLDVPGQGWNISCDDAKEIYKVVAQIVAFIAGSVFSQKFLITKNYTNTSYS